MNKKALICIVIFLMSISLINCSTDKETIITGRVQNLESTSIKINHEDVVLDVQRKFQYVLQLDQTDYIDIDFGKQFAVYLKPGDRVHIEIDASQGLDGISHRGDNVAINDFLLKEAYQSEKVNAEFNNNFIQLISLDEMAYKARMDEFWQPFHDMFEEFLSKNIIRDKYFKKSHEAILLYSKAAVLLKYSYWKRNALGVVNYSPPPEYFDFVKDLDFNDPDLLDVEGYREVLLDYLGLMTDKELAKSTAYEGQNYKSYRAKLKVALELFKDPEVRNEMLHSFMELFFAWYYQKGTEDIIETYREYMTNETYLAEMEEVIAHDESIKRQCEVRVYKTVGDIPLDAYAYLPGDLEPGEKRPAIAFFHGGGWECGKPQWGHLQCDHFSSLGMVGISFEYRLVTQHDATPLESIQDAKSAIRWMRANSEELHIDTDRIVASGYSAGGHLTLCTAMLDKWDEPDEDLSISSKPNAMLCWVTPGIIHEDGWFQQILKGKAKIKDVDPSSHIRPGLPPSVFFQGTHDDTVSPRAVKDFVKMMQDAGNRCDLHMFEGQTHLGWGENEADVLAKMDAFLKSLGFFDGLNPEKE